MQSIKCIVIPENYTESGSDGFETLDDGFENIGHLKNLSRA
jgi:hypothetical protein